MKYYFAYGSNLNLEQMSWRCPTARPVGVATLDDWQLVFKGSLSGFYLTIEPHKGSAVPLGVWEIDERSERSLDRYEGYPDFYTKTKLSLPMRDMDGTPLGMITGLIYIMNTKNPYGIPSRRYIHTCVEGYRDFGFDVQIMNEALDNTWRKM